MSYFKLKIPAIISKPFGKANALYLENQARRNEYEINCIPDVISFERIIANKSSSPITLAEFMDYLIYVQCEAEDLQFYLWLQDFERRFDDLPEEKKLMSPTCAEIANISSGDISAQCEKIVLPTAENRLKLYVSQPFRAEITRIVVHYLAPGGVRELNLSKQDRLSVLRGLQHTTHPSVSKVIRDVVFSRIKYRSHPMFIKWAMSNTSQTHRVLVCILAAMLMLTAIAGLVICLVLSAARPYRLFTVLPFAIAVFMGVSMLAKLCPIYYLWSHTRDLPPRQLYQGSIRNSSESCDSTYTGCDNSSTKKGDLHIYDMEKTEWSLDIARAARMDPLGPRNKWNNEPWIEVYERKSFLRKVFESTDTIKEEGMSIILRKVLLQSLTWSIILTLCWVIIILSLP